MDRSCPVDVISVCSSDGEIRPLRLRMEGEDKELRRLDIREVVSVKLIPYVGAEAYVFLCSTAFEGRDRLLELKYSIRSHTWWILRFLH